MTRPQIAILQPEVIDQIAAGEVVERPASVVKELVENALDAGARRVDVLVEQAGLGLIRVTDDGCGMEPAQAELSLERHATSKLRQSDDLWQISSLGFRGEALPSIAAVSRLTLVSRPPELDAGCRIAVEGGQRGPAEPAACRVGTTVEVRDLFYNTPARRKFLKSSATEAAHIQEAVSRLALAHPQVHFTLEQDTRRGLELPPCSEPRERAQVVLGRKAGPLSAGQRGEPGLEVEVCLAAPTETRRTPQGVLLTINGRSIKDRSLVHAVVAGYGSLLAAGQYPLAAIFLRLDPTTLDVNVHPQKFEVRLREARRVYDALRHCVRETLARAAPAPEALPASVSYPLRSNPGGYGEHKQRLLEATRRFWSQGGGPALAAEATVQAYGAAAESESAASASGYFSGLRLLGQLLGTYLVCEGEDELILIDQHAAHERVTYEGLRRAARDGPLPSQRLLIPVTLELGRDLAAVAAERQAELAQLGFELEPFGGDSWTVRAVPLALRDCEPGALAREVLEDLVASGQSSRMELAQEELLSRLACHGSVRAGRLLDQAAAQALLASLDQVDFAAHCPHGRPVQLRLTRAELESRFKRR